MAKRKPEPEATRTVRFELTGVDIPVPIDFCDRCARRLELAADRATGELRARGFCDHVAGERDGIDPGVGILIALEGDGVPRLLQTWRTEAFRYFEAVFALTTIVERPERRRDPPASPLH